MIWTALIPVISNVLDKVIVDKDARDAAKLKILEMNFQKEANELASQGAIVTAEASSESWLARTWRPLSMVVFLGMIVSYWFGYSPENMSGDVLNHLFNLIQLGLGGYIIGRSGEKMVSVYANMKTAEKQLEHSKNNS
jgi:hypothetical protein